MNYFSSKKKWMAYLILLTFVFTCIVPTNIVGGNSEAWANNNQQIVYAGGTKYYDANGNEVQANKAAVNISKTVTGTDKENEFDITLNIKTGSATETKKKNSAVVLTVDMSNTMDKTLDGGSKSRLQIASEKAQAFVKDYGEKGQVAGVKRYVAIVGFSSPGQVFQNWIDVSNANNRQAVINSIATWPSRSQWRQVSSSTHYYGGATNMEAGLQLSYELLNQSTATNVDKRYCILLSDGSPTMHIGPGYSNSIPNEAGYYYYYCNYSGCTAAGANHNHSGNNNNGGSTVSKPDYVRAEAVADNIKGLSNTKLYTFAIAYDADVNGQNPQTWLTNEIASSGCFVDATNVTALQSAFSGIFSAINTETIPTYTKPLSVTDPMGTNIALMGTPTVSIGKATVNNGTITWTMAPDAAGSFTMTYKIRLKNEVKGFTPDAINGHKTNGTTTLDYQQVKNGEGQTRVEDKKFAIPKVNGYLGEFSFTKTDEAGNRLTGADFKLVHATDCACNNVTIGDIADDTTTTDAVHSFTKIPSGHKYTLVETTSPNGYVKTDKTYIVTVNYGEVTVTENGTKVYDSAAGDKDMTVANKSTLTEVAVKKAWEDADNQDGKRPQSITVKLLADKQDTGKTLTLDKSNNWSGSFTKLEKYSGNREIAYTVAEVAVKDYLTNITGDVVNGFTITNTHIPSKVKVEGEKVWDDKDNQDGIRPASITVNLLADNVKVKSTTVTAENGWKYSFTNLDEYKNGQKIVYTVSEDEVKGYTTKIERTKIINTHTPELTKATVKKVWDDKNNQDGKRPTELKVTLVNTGEKVTLNKANGWTAKVENLPKYNNGQEITYTWTEDKMPEGYELTDTSVNGTITTLTNSYIPEKTSVTVKKVWNDGNEQYGIRPGSLEVFLSNGQSVILNAENNWTATIKELPKYADGQEIKYEWTEPSVPGYELTNVVTNGTVTTLTNTIEQSYFNIEGTKLWKDEEGNAIADPGVTSVEIQLFQNNEPYAKVTASAMDWTFEFKDVPRYNIDTVNGTVEKYEYRVAEVTTVVGYVPSYEVEKGEGNVINMTITNTRTYVEPGYMDIAVEKQWDDNDNAQGKRPAEIEVTLYQNGNEYQTVKVTAEDNWMYSFEELPECNDEGKPYSYTVAEKEVEGYISLVVPTADGYKLINTLYTDQIGQFAVGKKVSAGTNAPAADTEYGFLLRIEALQENWNDVLDGQYKQLEKEKAIAEDNAEAAAAKVTEAEDAFRTSATAFTTGSAYRFIMAEKPVATSGSAYEYEYTIADWYGRIFTEVTTGSAYMWEGLGAAEDADSVIDAVIKAIKELAKELSSVFQRTVFMDALNSLMDAENSTPSALGFHTADADALLFAERNRIAADELVAEREQAMKDFRFDATTPSAITVVLTPNEDNSTREEVVFDLTPESKYYDAETKSYFVDFTLFQNTGYTVTIEATTGTMVKYVVSEVNGFEAGADADYTYDGTDVAVNGEKLADDSLVRNTGALDLVKGIANSITFTNKYSNKVVEEETTTPEEEKKTEEKKEETKKDDPEEIIPDEDVPKGSVEIPGEILEELDDPEIPLGDAPATGDTNNAVPFMALLLAAIVGLVITRRKFN